MCFQPTAFFLLFFKLVGEFESANLFFFVECAHCQMKTTSHQIRARLFTVNDPKDVISVVQVNKMLLYYGLVTNVA